ncbi:MAG: hypothetical protein JRN06_11565 [Nitrososphaerota archaeon]|nr:hypothetical protein [Nitrososphaerota archaeon]
MNGKSVSVVFIVVAFAVAAVAAGFYFFPPAGGSITQSQTSSTTPAMQGVVTGYVTAGPSQPDCPAGQSCNENMTGYSLVFTPQCSGLGCAPSSAALNPSGHYSALLPAGTYSVTLSPSCPWVGCASVFPQNVTVVGGGQLVQNFEISTGIA